MIMYTREQLQAMSNHSINALLAYLATGVDYTIYENQVKLLNGGASIDYCNSPNDIMPLAFERKVSLIPLDSMNGWAADSYCELFNFMDENPLRAIACCLILVLQERGK